MIIEGEEKVYVIAKQTFHCGTAVAFQFFGGKWKSIIIWYLRHGKLRFSQLKKLIPDITDKMLSIQLKALIDDNLIGREIFGEKPPYCVEYSLTKTGKSLIPVLEKITEWGINYAEKNGSLIKAHKK
ncbi:winged helix-turn-helix transcriptional regulator [Flavobacterium sp.]|uniref:winged helix-turn-helix transcriptional regulator n=1 Tax=Flavobacterium sp. TaxID=239 RepID=UPI003D2B8114